MSYRPGPSQHFFRSKDNPGNKCTFSHRKSWANTVRRMSKANRKRNFWWVALLYLMKINKKRVLLAREKFGYITSSIKKYTLHTTQHIYVKCTCLRFSSNMLQCSLKVRKIYSTAHLYDSLLSVCKSWVSRLPGNDHRVCQNLSKTEPSVLQEAKTIHERVLLVSYEPPLFKDLLQTLHSFLQWIQTTRILNQHLLNYISFSINLVHYEICVLSIYWPLTWLKIQ